MNHKTIAAHYLGPRSNTVDLLVQARCIHAAAVLSYRQAHSKARTHCAQKLLALRQKSRLSGYRSGMKQATSEIAELINRIDSLYEMTVREANEACLNLALSIAEEILSKEIGSSHITLASRISCSIESLLNVSEIRISLNPKNLRGVSHALKKRFPELDLQCSSDSAVEPGDALIESSSGITTLRWRDQLALVRESLTRSLSGKITSLSSP